jgi:hypothetical protein
MKLLLRAICALFLLSCAVRAQETDEEDSSEFLDSSPDFSDLIVYVPKLSISIGFRSLSGVNASFAGKATFGGLEAIGTLESGTKHYYHDGYVLLDTRTMVDSAGNTVSVEPDGKTNNWQYANDNQETSDTTTYQDASGNTIFVGTGYIAMHSYTVDSDDTAFSKDSKGTYGVELTGSRQMGKLFGGRASWLITTGFGINDISSTSEQNVNGTLTTVTDYYSLDGQAGPGGSSSSTTKVISDTPLGRHTDVTTIEGEILNHYRLRGAYLTFRAGPTLVFPLFSRLSATISAGGVLVYAGTNYSVTEIFLPEAGNYLVDGATDGASTILPGYYADANLQWRLTDNSDLYFGAVYQSSGSYTQTIESTVEAGDTTSPTQVNYSRYTARVDLASLQGFRAGFALRF